MKSRNGFVSNSSSSSFVIIGYRLDDDFDVKNYFKENYPEGYDKVVVKTKEYVKKDIERDGGEYTEGDEQDEQFKDIFEDCFWDVFYDFMRKSKDEYLTYLSDDGPGYLGKVLAEENDYSIGSANLNAKEIKETMERVQEKLGFDEPPSLIVGSRCT